MATEWGVKHAQGIRPCFSEKAAYEDLGMLTRSWERSQFKHDQSRRPVVVSREVSDWSPAEAPALA